jgi:thioredoxin 1
MAKEITKEIFDEISKEDKLIVLDFWAPWCGPCRTIAPIIEELSNQYPDVHIGKVNVDDNPELSTMFGIRNIPTVLFIKGGQVLDKQIGGAQKSAYEDKITKLK